MIDACHGTRRGRLNSGLITRNSAHLTADQFYRLISHEQCLVKFAPDFFASSTPPPPPLILSTPINCNYYRYSLAVRSTSLSSWVPLNRVVIIVEMEKLCRLLYSL